MKNSILTSILSAALLFIGSNAILAQKGLQLGLEVNPQLSYLYNQDDMDSPLFKEKHAVNGHFGVSGQYGITEKIGVGLNILYSIQGDKYEWKNVERLKSLHYVKIPLMFTLSLPLGTDMMFVGKAGPQISLLSLARLYDKDKNIIRTDYSQAFMPYDFGGMISAGIAYNITSSVSIDAALRYDFGVLDAEDKNFDDNIHDPSDAVTPSPASSPRSYSHNMTIGLNVGVRYTFP